MPAPVYLQPKIKLRQGGCFNHFPDVENGSVDLILADPPYGTTACKWDSIIPLEPMWEQLKRVIKPNGAVVLFGSQPFTSVLVCSNLKMFKYSLVWDKVNGVRNHLNAKKQPMRVKEDVVVFYEKQATYNPQMRVGGYKSRKTQPGQSDVFGKVTGIDKGREVTSLYPLDLIHIKSHDPNNSKHPTQKPVALMEYLIKTYTNEGETVLDFTMGSGTTGVAAMNLNRNFIGFEKEPEYFEIATNRIFNKEMEN